MFSKIASFVKESKELLGLAVLLVGLLIPLISQCSKVNELEEKNLALKNDIAEKSKLEAVFTDTQNANFTLKERNSFLEEDNAKLRVSNVSVLRRLKETNSRLLAYSESNSQLTIENKRLWGAVQDTTKGILSARYQEKTEHYSFDATAYIFPETYLDLALIVYDSTYVGIRESEDGEYVGFIGHSNPLIEDNGAVFSYALGDVLSRQSSFAWRIGVGPAWNQHGSIVPVGLVGVKYRNWGLTGFLSGETKGLILMRDF